MQHKSIMCHQGRAAGRPHAQSQVRSYGAGDTLIKQGERGDDFFVLEKGKAAARVDGKRVKDCGVHRRALVEKAEFSGDRSKLALQHAMAASLGQLSEESSNRPELGHLLGELLPAFRQVRPDLAELWPKVGEHRPICVELTPTWAESLRPGHLRAVVERLFWVCPGGSSLSSIGREHLDLPTSDRESPLSGPPRCHLRAIGAMSPGLRARRVLRGARAHRAAAPAGRRGVRRVWGVTHSQWKAWSPKSCAEGFAPTLDGPCKS